ncbi:hypothetical protein EON65_39360, partial [archaeon]
KETVLELCDILPNGDISAEVVAIEYGEMVREAEEIASWHPNIVVKVPLIEPGIRLVKHLSDKGIRTNVTLVFTVGQALLAAKAGATYISNFVGRVDDLSLDGMDAVKDSVQMVETYGFASEILVASVRHPLHVLVRSKGSHTANSPIPPFQHISVCAAVIGISPHPVHTTPRMWWDGEVRRGTGAVYGDDMGVMGLHGFTNHGLAHVAIA